MRRLNFFSPHNCSFFSDVCISGRGGSRADATSKIERFAIIVNGSQPLTIIKKRAILDIAAALDLPLSGICQSTNAAIVLITLVTFGPVRNRHVRRKECCPSVNGFSQNLYIRFFCFFAFG